MKRARQAPPPDRRPAPSRALGQATAARPSLATFLAAAGAMLLAYVFPYPSDSAPARLLHAHLSLLARSAGAVLALVDPRVRVEGLLIDGRYPLRIMQSCDAAEPIILYLAMVLAWPVAPRARVVGAALGVAVVAAANLARIASLYYVGVARPDLFELVHAHLWPMALLLVATATFAAWAAWAGAREGGDGPPASA